jgi:hypothetical protein
VAWTRVRASDFQSRHLLLALKAGEQHRVARALWREAKLVATEGHRAERTVRPALAPSALKVVQHRARRPQKPRRTVVTPQASSLTSAQVKRFLSLP